ncbi:MAG: hypothetical protein ACSLFB_02780 [Acidimicrobiales bacterium]
MHHYGARPEFVVLGGLVPELLCAGTGFASWDPVVQQLTARIGGDLLTVEVNVSGLAGFLLAKSAEARCHRLPKDWYDVAFVLFHNDLGGAAPAARAAVPFHFGPSHLRHESHGSRRTASLGGPPPGSTRWGQNR